jgi:cell division protein FtsI/penicillin-binding protein 2
LPPESWITTSDRFLGSDVMECLPSVMKCVILGQTLPPQALSQQDLAVKTGTADSSTRLH